MYYFFRFLRKNRKELLWAFATIPLIFNYFFWVHGTSTAYIMSMDFQRVFWILAPLVSLFAFTQIDSGNYLPSFNRIGLTWQASYFLEKCIHLICCFISISSFLCLLTALLIRGAPNQYMETHVAQLDKFRFINYHYYWQLTSTNEQLSMRHFKISGRDYRWLDNHRRDPIRVRLKQNIAGSSVTVIKK